jgi:fatty-acyl-CoA synthase
MEWKVVPAAQPTDQTGQANEECAQGETGVVLFRGPSVFPGYLDARQNAEILTKDGWAITGDLGFISNEGHLAITGRAKDLIMRGGHNIDPALIEESLLQHPAVALAAAVGKPDEYAQELPVVYAELNPGEQASEAELLEFLTQNITERPALPKAVHIIETMPLTAVGKIFKPPLRWAQIEAVFAEALAPLAEDGIETEVSVSESKQHGTLAKVSCRVTDPSAGENAEVRIRQVLDRFTVQYQLN